ncbi:MAG TPA: ABC transporter substrate-binding protein [Kofleriaceae bacterium]|nr:ABC transporter substrate-binding protein [Kofleriaceae bacterium]
MAGVLTTAGCAKKKTEDKSKSGAASDKATPGVTATEIKIGQCMPYSGPASAYGAIGKGDVAFAKMINDKGGINGRKINLISLDDGYNPAKAVEQTRKLVEDEGVAFVFNSVGTANNSAVQSYLNQKKVPQLFVATGADKWGDPAKFPWTMGWQPSYRIESKIYAQYLMKEKPGAKVCVIYQNDDFGKDYLIGFKEGFGDQYDKFVTKSVSYEVTDPTVDSQVVTMQAAGCDTLITAATPKFAAGVIRKVFDIGWKPLHIISNVSASITAVLKPAGLDKSTGIITGLYLKDPNDPALATDPGMVEYKDFMKKYLPELDPNDGNTVYAFDVMTTLVKVLTECGNDLSRESIMKHAASLSKFSLPLGIQGLEINTSATDFRPISQLQLSRFNGTNFERIADIQGAE